MNIIINVNGEQRVVDAKKHQTIYEVLKSNNIPIAAPCGGGQKCGKCYVKVKNVSTKPTDHEIQLLGKNRIDKNYRLSCFLRPEENMEITMVEEQKINQILTTSQFVAESLNPPLTIEKIKIEKSKLENQTSDWDNLKNTLNEKKINGSNLKLIQSITKAIQKSNYHPNAIFYKDELVGITHKEMDEYYAIAVDIGTTTVAVYLFDMNTGRILDVVSDLNKQKSHGADVISRIQYASKSASNLLQLQKDIISQINRMIGELITNHKIKKNQLHLAVIAGNTTMMHLFMKLDPEGIGRSPFIPVTIDLHEFDPQDLGMKINSYGKVICLPSLSGYIGADVIAGVVATQLHKKDDISILLDIGTNGEIVLGNRDKMISCSTAAGPAFEGANIRFGTGGVEGAIDKVEFKDNEVVFTTINNAKPIGICGSGVVDVVAQLLQHDIIDETGRFLDEDEIDTTDPLTQRIVEYDGMKAFQLMEDIYFTQKDIREIQNAKAAIAAGINILIDRYGIKVEDVKHLYLAGGFGNYINVESAAVIGLIPSELKERVIPAGNTAGAGASMCLVDQNNLEDSVHISHKIEYIELSKDKAFTDEYIECMIF